MDILPKIDPEHEELAEWFDEFHEDSAIVRVVHAIRGVAAVWPGDVDLTPLVTTIRFEADRLEHRQEGRR